MMMVGMEKSVMMDQVPNSSCTHLDSQRGCLYER